MAISPLKYLKFEFLYFSYHFCVCIWSSSFSESSLSTVDLRFFEAIDSEQTSLDTGYYGNGTLQEAIFIGWCRFAIVPSWKMRIQIQLLLICTGPNGVSTRVFIVYIWLSLQTRCSNVSYYIINHIRCHRP